jgi:hypothetical protein
VSGHESYDASGDRRATTVNQVTGRRVLDLEV